MRLTSLIFNTLLPTKYPCVVARTLLSEMLITVLGYQLNLPLLMTSQCWINAAIGAVMMANLWRAGGLCAVLGVLEREHEVQCLVGPARCGDWAGVLLVDWGDEC